MTTTANSQFFAILTAVGEAKQANANALGVPWTFSAMGVGDANGTEPIPSRTQTSLIAEKRRAGLNQVKVDPTNASIIIAEQVIPPDVGGWWIREIGLYDADGDLVAVANCAPSFKPLLSQGTGKTQVVRLNIIVTSTANVQLKIDPSVVLATRDYIETVIMTVLPPTRPAGTFTKVQINNRGVVVAGENPTTLAGYGITDALKRGSYGLGGSTAPVAEVDSVGLAGGFYFFGDGETSFANYISLMNVPYGNGKYAAQVGFTQGTPEPVMLVRTCSAENTFGPTRRVWHSGDFDPANKANKATTLAGYGIADALQRGECGLGSDVSPVAEVDTVGLPGGFYFVGDGNTSFANYISLLNVPYGDDRHAAQIGFTQGTVEPVMLVRTCSAENVFGPTREVYHSGNFSPAGKADKATTLAGYGITDAQAKSAALTALAGQGGNGLYVKTAAGTSAARSLAVTGAGLKVENADGLAGNPTLSLLATGVVADVYPVVTVDALGRVTAGRALQVSDVPSLPWSKIGSGTPTTLAGYGITAASQPEAEAGADNAKPMTALRVFQAIAKVVTQASETAFGWLKIATQDQVNTGTDDAAAVTSKKLRGGFAYSFGTNSFIALPTWLGALIVQWGSAVSDGTGVAVVTLPSTFPSGSFQVIPTVLSASFSTYSVNRASSNASSFTALTTSGNVAVAGASFGWLAIGR